MLLSVALAALLASPSAGQRAGVTKAPIPSHIVALAVTPSGFDPPALAITAGNTFFSVYNRTALPDLTLQLDQTAEGLATAQRLKSGPLARSKKAWRDITDLAPGVYTITVAEMPKLQFRLTVRAK